MTVTTLIAIIRFLIWLVGTVYSAIESLPPEEKEQLKEAYLEWQEAIKNCQDPMGGPPDGSGP